MKTKFTIALLIISMPFGVFSQSNFMHLNFHVDTNQSVIIGGRSEAFSNSNTLSATVTNSALYGGYISREDRQSMLDKASDQNNTGTWFNTSLFFAQRIDTLFGKKKTGLSFFANIADRQENNALYSKNALSLVMFGNKQFLGTSTDFAPLNFNQYHYQQFEIGFNQTYSSGISITLGASYLYGQTNRRGITEDLMISHSDFGDQMDVYARILVQQTDPNHTDFMNYNGSGFSLDFQTEIPLQIFKDTTNPGMFTFTIADLGAIFWNGTSREYKVDTSFSYNGIQIDDVFDPSSPTSGLEPSELYDSIVTEQNVSHTTTLPFSVRLQMSQRFKKTTVDVGAIFRYRAFYRTYFYGKVGYQFHEKWNAFGQVNYGGYGNFGGGLGINYSIKKLELELGSSNIEGFIVPTKVAGQSIYVLLKLKL